MYRCCMSFGVDRIHFTSVCRSADMTDVRTHKSKFRSVGTSFCSNSHYRRAVYRGLQMSVGVDGPYKKIHLPNSCRMHETIVFKKYTP